MKKLFSYLTILMLIASPVFAGTTSTNGYFYLPSVGESNSNMSVWVDANEATDAVIKGVVDASGLNTTHRTSDGSDHSDVVTNSAKVTNATHTGDVTGSGALTIGNDKVLEVMLKSVNGATDEYCLTYEATTGDFEWQSCGAGSSSPLTTKGDVWGYSTTDARIPIGANDTVLTADSTQALGVKWATVSGLTEENNLELDGVDGILTTEIFIGNANDEGTYQTLGGDVTMNTIGEVTIADNRTVTGWDLGTSVATTPAPTSNGTSLATTAFVTTAVSGVSSPEGTAVLSTGEVGASKFLREDGDGTSSWQSVSGSSNAVIFSVCSSTASWACDYTCDGTDDDVQIQQALTDLPSEGGTVVLSEGTFHIDAAVDLDHQQALVGQGHSTHLLNESGADTGVITSTSTTGMSLTDMRIDGDGTNQSTAFVTVDLTDVKYSKFENLWITGGLRTGTYPSVSSDGEGIVLRGSHHNTLNNIHAYDNAYDGIKLRCSDYNSITNIVCEDNARACIQISSSSAAPSCTDGSNYNTFSNISAYHSTGVAGSAAPNTSGFYIHNGSYNSISNMSIYGYAQGIGTLVDGGTTDGNTFSDITMVIKPIDGEAGEGIQQGGDYSTYNNITMIFITGTGSFARFIEGGGDFNVYSNIYGLEGDLTGAVGINMTGGTDNKIINSYFDNLSEQTSASYFFGNTGDITNRSFIQVGDDYDFSAVSDNNSYGLVIPQDSACISNTDDGRLCWDTDDDKLVIGTGGGVVDIGPGSIDTSNDFVWTGTNDFQTTVTVEDEAYGAGWNGSTEIPTKNAVYDKIETLGGGSGTIDGTGSTGKVAIWSAGTTLTYDEDFTFANNTMSSNTVNVDYMDSKSGGALAVSTTMLIDSGDTLGSAISFAGTTSADGCTTWGEGSIFYNTTDDVFCFCNTTTSIRMATTASCF